MAGESPEEGRAGNPDEFLSKSKWERFQVLIMGPLMNLFLALGLTALVLYQGAQVPAYEDQPAIVGEVTADSPAARAGIRKGDRLVSVAGSRVENWEQFLFAVASRPNKDSAIGLIRDGEEITLQVTPEVLKDQSKYEIGVIGVMPDVHPHVPSLVQGDPAERAGVKVGDMIVAVDGRPITFSSHLRD